MKLPTSGDLAKAEQSFKLLSQILPRACKEMYRGFVEAGFPTRDALQLTSDWMVATFCDSKGIGPDVEED